MALDRSAFVGNFVDEAHENIHRVDDGVVRLRKDPENQEELNVVLRALHTIKGSSRMLKFRSIEQLAHGEENLFKGVQEGRYELSTALMQLIFVGNDLLRQALQAILSGGEDTVQTDEYLMACERAYANEPFTAELEALQRSRTGATVQETAPVDLPDSSEAADMVDTGNTDNTGNTVGQAVEAGRPAEAATQSSPKLGAAGPSYESIRVKQSQISEIIETLNSVIIKQFQFKKIQDELRTVEQEQRQALASARKRLMALRTGPAKEELATYIAEQSRQMKPLEDLRKTFVEQIAVLEQNSYKLQEQVMKLTMLPMELVFGELPRMVAETAAMLSKEIDFRITGSDILMDKAILERLNDPIIHLVRNAVDHGIESSEERESAGKDPVGRISIECSAEAGSILIRIRDDGRGIDPERVQRKAVERGLVAETDLAEMSEQETLSLIFTPGFSTNDTVTDLSGRGVGLDIVKFNIDKVKGKITIHSTKGEGAEFRMVIPLSLATVSGFFVSAGGERFLIPSNFVQKVVRLSRDETLAYYNKEAFKLEGQIIPIYSLAALLGRSALNTGANLYVVVVESMGDRIGVVVDAVLQHAALIYKPVPRNMQKLRVIQGIVFDESYRIINILFVPELIGRFRYIKSIDLIGGVRGELPTARTVLVVDDSLNTREIERSILELEGYEVSTAADGIEGLERTKERRFDMIISDIDMPRMDGITMIENIRKDPLYAATPIVVVTSYSEPEIVQRARAAGANAHIVKSDFDRTSLVQIAGELLEPATERGR